jgi:hypothetical protein
MLNAIKDILKNYLILREKRKRNAVGDFRMRGQHRVFRGKFQPRWPSR